MNTNAFVILYYVERAGASGDATSSVNKLTATKEEVEPLLKCDEDSE